MPTKDEHAVSTTNDTAIWIWDPDRLRIIWANEPGLRFWGETSLLDLIERDFAPFDEATHDFGQLLAAVLRRESGRVRARMILAPNGKPIRINCRAQRVALPDGRPGLRLEAEPAPVGEDAEVERLREIIERTPTAISLFAEDGALLMQNAAAEQAFGSADLEGLAQRYGDKRAARDALRSLLVNGVHSHAVELRTVVGRRRHRVTMRRMHDPMTGGLAAIVFFTDIADRAPSLLAAARSEAQAETALLTDLDAGALVFDDALKILYLSDSARRMLGKPDGAKDDNLTAVFPRDRQRIAQALTRIRDRQADRADIELPLEASGEGAHWLRLSVRRGGWRGAAAWLATLTDVTDAHRMTDAMRRTVQERDSALESLGIGVATLRADGVVEAITETGAALLGTDAAATLGHPLDIVLNEAGVTAFRSAMAARDAEPQVFLIDRPREDGEAQHPLRMALSPLEGRSEQRTLVFSEAANGLRNGFGTSRSEAIARASHELRTPLNAIIGFTQIMLDDERSVNSDIYRGYLQDINESGQYMARLVQDMLDLRRIEAGALSLDPAPVNAANLIRRVARDLESAARSRDVTITVSMEDNLPNIVADAHTMRQALTNLMGNAVKFTSSPGWVRVSASRRGSGALQIDVADNGEGMTPEELEHAQQPYAQGRHSSRKFGGAGMGLPLARGFIEANGAQFEMTSEKHAGSTARIVFPSRLVESSETE